MNCSEANQLLSARLDGEIARDEETALEEHLSSCSECRAAADALATQDARLRRAFASRRQSAIGVGDAALERFVVPDTARRNWRPIALAAAAGFLLALMIFPPWRHRQPLVAATQGTTSNPQPATTQSVPAPRPIAQLALATGRVDIRPKGSEEWRPMETGGAVPPEAHVRTGPGVRCEFALADGSEVRLNEGTEIQFASTRKLELTEGQVWSQVVKAPTEFTLNVAAARIVAVGTRFDVACRQGTTRLVVLEGTTHVYGAELERIVTSGESVEMTGYQCSVPQRMYGMAAAERWVDEILVLKGRDNPELKQRIDDLMAQLGEDKLAFLYESEIRGLGDHCVVPLTRYIQSDRSSGSSERRQKAARILADSAQPWCIPFLIELLSERDAEIRATVASGLTRVSGTTIGNESEWRTGSSDERQKLVANWQHWWSENKEHIPGGGRTDKARSSQKRQDPSEEL